MKTSTYFWLPFSFGMNALSPEQKHLVRHQLTLFEKYQQVKVHQTQLLLRNPSLGKPSRFIIYPLHEICQVQ